MIDPRCRRVFGRTMMNAVERLARTQNVSVLEVHAASDAVAFYERIGWEMVDADRASPLMTKTL
ncbi:GNAT family N-acetyltransferase [Rhizobium sp. BK313]|uniref:GNAT family N-acetyltransferase n=1 Tax=Rhizobium sp. BK313 TaxID=2587081 RepID=UPI0039184133